MKGITINDIPVQEWLQQEQDTLKEKEAREIYKNETYAPLYHKPSLKRKTQPEKDGDVKKLTDDEIRKEYGIDKKPFNSLRKNVYWLLDNYGDMDSRKIAEKVGYQNHYYINQIKKQYWQEHQEEEEPETETVSEKREIVFNFNVTVTIHF